MIKKITVSDLCPNMYIHDLNCGWMEHNFLHNSFLVKSREEIEKIVASGIREVYIDTSRGLDVREAPTADDVRRQLENQMQHLGRKLKGTPQKPVAIQEELVKARRIFNEASAIVNTVLLDCRMGKQVQVEKLEPIISSITGSIFRNPDAIISLLKIKQADSYTFQHSVAVSTLLISFCRAMEVDRETIELVGIGGLLHDIGKMKVPDRILNKPGKLTEKEFDLMKKHVSYGCLLLENTPSLSSVSISIAAEHHERYDGSGYPLALKGDQISLYGQMAAIVDVYDALTSNRIYHSGIEPTEVLKKMLEWSEYHFNTALVHNFIRTIGIYPVGTLVRLESGYLAVVIEQNHDDLLHPKVRLIFNAKAQSFIPPRDIDLGRPSIDDRIVTFEIPSRWHIDPLRFLG